MQQPYQGRGIFRVCGLRNREVVVRGYDGAETCKQSSRGAVLVPSTYGWDNLAATVVRRSQAAHCSHLRSRVSVGLEAPKGNQRGSRAGRRAEQTFGSNVPDPP